MLTLKERMVGHFGMIKRNDPKSEVGLHFNLPNHAGINDVTIYIVDFIYAAPRSDKAAYLRDLCEFNWIQRLRSNAPSGLNTMDAHGVHFR